MNHAVIIGVVCACVSLCASVAVLLRHCKQVRARLSRPYSVATAALVATALVARLSSREDTARRQVEDSMLRGGSR
jgi:hypothetical protein